MKKIQIARNFENNLKISVTKEYFSTYVIKFFQKIAWKNFSKLTKFCPSLK